MADRTDRVIDAHHHVWDPAIRPQPWLDDTELAPLRRRFDLADLAIAARDTAVAATVLVQVLADAGETRDFLALAADVGPASTARTGVPGGSMRVAGVVGWVDLTAPDVADQIAALRAGPGGDLLVGIRHLVQAEPDPRWLVRPEVLAGLRAVAAAGLVYDLLVTPLELPAAVDAVRAVPEGRFVLDHLGKPPIAEGWSSAQPWLQALGALATLDGLAVKLSGLVTEADHARWTVAELRPWVDATLTAFGPSRMMFGSDWPVCLVAASYDRVADSVRELVAGLDPDERADIAGATAQRWYALTR
jgi:L-fuconolactonase